MKFYASSTKMLQFVIMGVLISCNYPNNSSLATATADSYTPSKSNPADTTNTSKTALTPSAINDYEKAVAKDGQVHFLESIKEDIGIENFAEAKNKFDYVNKYFPPKGTSGIDLYTTEQQNLYDEIKIDLKVYRAMNARHEPAPTFQFLNGSSGTITHLKVINETPYPMSLALSGTHSIEVNLAPGKWKIITLKTGQYNSSASVISSSSVAQFAGTEQFKAGDYQVVYSVKNI